MLGGSSSRSRGGDLLEPGGRRRRARLLGELLQKTKTKNKLGLGTWKVSWISKVKNWFFI